MKTTAKSKALNAIDTSPHKMKQWRKEVLKVYKGKNTGDLKSDARKALRK